MRFVFLGMVKRIKKYGIVGFLRFFRGGIFLIFFECVNVSVFFLIKRNYSLYVGLIGFVF